MRKALILIIVGLPGSGKSIAAGIIKKKFDADIVHSGDVVREEVNKRGLKYTPKTDALVAHWFHTSGREKLMAKRVWDKVRISKKRIIVIEGLRSPKVFYYLKKFSKTKPFIITVNASFEMRVERELKRGRFGKEETLNYLKTREKLEKSHGIKELMKKSDYRIDNTNLTVRQMENKIVKVVKSLI